MIRKLGENITFAVAVMCAVPALAVADEMTCVKAADKGCTTAKRADGKEVAVMGAGMKVGEKMDCRGKGAWTGQAKKAVPNRDEVEAPTGFLRPVSLS